MNAARRGFAWAGLTLSVVAIAISTEVGYSAAAKSCGMQVGVSAVTALACLALALVAGFVSVAAWRYHGQLSIDEPPSGAKPVGLIASISLGSSLLFTIMIALQLAASFIVSGCQI
jgi:hypothetical protein